MQFSLRTFLIYVGLFCVYCAMTFALPLMLSLLGLTLLSFALPLLVIGGIVYGRGAARAFWIGCAPGSVLLLVAMYMGAASLIGGMSDMEELDESGRMLCAGLAFCHVTTAMYGLGMIGIRWFYGVGRSQEESAKGDVPDARPMLIHRRVILDESVEGAVADTPIHALDR